jgi:SAM-dependent methyltransferase
MDMEIAAVVFYEHARTLSIRNGLWFCAPCGPETFAGWAVPPLATESGFRIRANGVSCSLEGWPDFPQAVEDIFQRFGMPSPRYTFMFRLPELGNASEILLECEFGPGKPIDWFQSLCWPGLAPGELPETPALNVRRVTGSDDFETFVLTGYTQHRHLMHFIAQHAPGARNILDWGCGAARVMRYFMRQDAFFPYGVDVDACNIKWCQEAFGKTGEFRLIEPLAELPFAANAFDVAYGISVFTHLSQESERFWLRELHRVLKKGALAVMTVHGELAFFKAVNDLFAYIPLVRDGFLDVGACPDLRIEGRETISESLYRNVFHTRQYLEAVWGEYFTIVDYVQGCASAHHTAHQDYVIMLRK